MTEIQDFIKSVKWKFARTMPQHPHEYIVRWDYPDLNDQFVHFARYIREHGYDGNFYKKKLIYLDIDDHKYWTMGDPIHNSIEETKQNMKCSTFILNRARLNLNGN